MGGRWSAAGFTLVELLLVLALIAVIAALAFPVVSNSIQHAKESALKENLYVMRKSIDDYYADKGKYPTSLEALIKHRYLRKIPVDPITERADSWVAVKAEGEDEESGIMDVRSNSDGKASDGSQYKDW